MPPLSGKYPEWVTTAPGAIIGAAMPIGYEIDPELGIVKAEFSGEIRYADLERFWKGFLADPAVPDPPLIFADMRDCGVLVQGDDLSQLVRTVSEPLLGGRRWVFAAVAESEAVYGATKQFMVYSRECGVTDVFRDEDKAIMWLVEMAGPLQKRDPA